MFLRESEYSLKNFKPTLIFVFHLNAHYVAANNL